MSKPAHKQDDQSQAPGQIVTSPPAAVTDKTLADYIRRKQLQDAFDAVALENQARANEKKMTFDEWLQHRYAAVAPSFRSDMEECWKAAQENKK